MTGTEGLGRPVTSPTRLVRGTVSPACWAAGQDPRSLPLRLTPQARPCKPCPTMPLLPRRCHEQRPAQRDPCAPEGCSSADKYPPCTFCFICTFGKVGLRPLWHIGSVGSNPTVFLVFFFFVAAALPLGDVGSRPAWSNNTARRCLGCWLSAAAPDSGPFPAVLLHSRAWPGGSMHRTGTSPRLDSEALPTPMQGERHRVRD